jgi:hypothetical protein
MDTVRLRIVYETGQAASKLQALDQQLTRTQTASASANHGAGQLKRGLESLAFSAAGVPGPIGKIAIGLLQFGAGSAVVLGTVAGLAVIAGAYKLLTKELRDAEKAVKDTDAAFRSALAGQGSVQAANLALADAQKKLRDLKRDLAEQRALAEPHLVPTFGRGGVPTGTHIEAGSATAQRAVENLTHAIDTQQRTVDLLRAVSTKAYEDIAAAATKANTPFQAIADGFASIRANVDALIADPAFQEFIQSIAGLNPKGVPGPLAEIKQISDEMMKAKLGPELTKPVTAATLEAAHASDLLIAGMQGMTAAILTFVETGTFAFAQFLDNLLRLAAGDAIENLLTQTFAGTGSTGDKFTGEVKGTIPEKVAPVPSVSTNVNFNIQAMDAQGVAQFMDRNAPLIADAVVKEADRSRSIRRRFWRG